MVFIGKTSDTSKWTVDAYQWGIEGHHYPHTDNGPPQGQPGHWGKQNKRRYQYYTIQIVWTKFELYAFHFRFLSYNDDNYDDNDFILHCTLLLFCWTYTYGRHLHMICTIVL